MKVSLPTEIRHLLVLAAPLILAQLAQSSMAFVDTLMVGRLGDEALAGIALGGTLFFFVFILLSGTVLAVGPMVSQAYGAGDREKVARATRQGLWLAVFLAVVAGLFFWNARPLLLLMGQEPATAARASAYLRAISWGFLPALWLTVLRSLLEGLAKPRPVMLIALFGVGLNVLANYVLMFGKLGFPALGLVGTGYASALVYWTMFCLAFLYVRWALKDYRIFWALRKPDLRVLRELFAIGWPIGLTLGFEVGLFSVTALLMGLLGPLQLAAHQIALQTASITFMVPLGLSIAISVRVGQAAGRKDPVAVRRSGFVGIGLSAAFMVLTALTFRSLPRPIVGLYIDTLDPANRDLVALATSYLGIAAMFQVFDGLQVSASGALRGLKDTRIPMLISLFSYWGVGLGTGTSLAFGLGWGGRGLWLGLVAGLGTAALLLTLRFARNARRSSRAVVPATGR